MFNLFKKKPENPITELFSTTTTNQKISIINLLIRVASIDEDLTNGIQPKEIQFINLHIEMLQLKTEVVSRFDSLGVQGIIEDLKNLNSKQKEFLIVIVYRLICVDGKPNETELSYFEQTINLIGISSKSMNETIKKFNQTK